MRLERTTLIAAATVAALAFMSPASAQALRVGTHPTTPFGGPPPGGGYCVDLMTAIAERIGRQVEFSFMPPGQFLDALTGNTIDAVCTGFGPTQEFREAGIAFSSAIFVNNEGLIVVGTDTTPYTTAADFQGQPVGVVAGSPYVALWANAGVQNAREFAAVPDAYTALRAGEIKAIITGAPAFLYQQLQGNLVDLRLVDTYTSTLIAYPALGVRNTDTELLGELQATLEALKADGTVATLLERWALPAPPF